MHVDGLLSKPPRIGDIRAMLRRVVHRPNHRKNRPLEEARWQQLAWLSAGEPFSGWL